MMTIVNYQLKTSGISAVDIMKWLLVLLVSINFLGTVQYFLFPVFIPAVSIQVTGLYTMFIA